MIELRNISKAYKGKSVYTNALKNINLNVKKGEFIAIMGRSGCGKTTLLNILGCMDNFDEGEYLFNKIDIRRYNNKQLAMFRNKNIGFVFQSFYLINDMTAVENVEVPMGFAGTKRNEMRKNATKLLHDMGLGDKVSHRPLELSGGQQQRVAIARALANNPKIIFADEPTGNLDEASGIRIMELLKQLNQHKGVTVVMVTHDNYIAEYANYVIKMKDGMIV